MSSAPIYFSKPGVACSTGVNLSELWNSVLNGNQDGIRKVKTEYGNEFFAAKIDDKELSPVDCRYDMRIIRIEEKALAQIDSTIKCAVENYGAERVGVCVGSCDNGTEFSVKNHKVFFETGKFPEDYSLEIQSADYIATYVSEKYSLKGPSVAFSTACSSSAGAIIKAAEMIRAGIIDAAIFGGVDVASDTVLLGFNSLEAVSSEITNPFSKNRHGITIGEGAAFFVLSKDNLENTSYAIVLAGYGESADAYHMTSPDPEGVGAEIAIRKAIVDANILPKDIGYLNLHGTGTKFNDSMEAKAVSRVFGEYNVPCSSTKSMTGHTLGAAAALEAAICYLTLTNNVERKTKQIPLQVWDGIQDENMPKINIISKDNCAVGNAPLNYCMSNSFAFGGSNACLILKIAQ